MRKIFINSDLEQRFQKDGYVRIPFISNQEVNELKQLFFDTLVSSGGQITSGETGTSDERLITYDFTFIDKNPEYKQKVFEIITKYFKPHMNNILANYRPIIANYIRKKSETGEVPLHQNWAFADERKCTTISIWCPLVDSTIDNGTLQVVPGSHKRFGEYRGPMVPWELENIKKEIIDQHLIPLETNAGDCVILDDSIVHYSAVNITNDLRLAIQLICVPNEFPSIHYYMDPQSNPNEIKVLEVLDDFYMQFNPWKKTDSEKVIKKIPFKTRFINQTEFIDRLSKPAFDQPLSKRVLDKVKKIFSSNG